MATHTSILAWRIPRTEGPGGLQSMGSQRVAQGGTIHTTKAPSPLAPQPLGPVSVCRSQLGVLHLGVCALRAPWARPLPPNLSPAGPSAPGAISGAGTPLHPGWESPGLLPFLPFLHPVNTLGFLLLGLFWNLPLILMPPPHPAPDLASSVSGMNTFSINGLCLLFRSSQALLSAVIVFHHRAHLPALQRAQSKPQ